MSRLAGLCPSCAWKALLEEEPQDDRQDLALEPGGLFRIPGYQVLAEIARGGMGIVYRARQLEPRRDVALKMLLPHQLSSASMRDRFRLEARAIAALEHPGILPVFGSGEHNGMPFFTMKLASGGSLAERRVQYQGQWRQIAELVARIAEAVHFAHVHGVLHRDLKPANILFDGSDHPFVSDFGLAKIGDANSSNTRTGHLFGTPQYLAPEIARGSASNATTASDQYSLGALLYELLTGKPPFVRDDILELLRAIGEEPLTPPRQLVPQIPPDLEVICQKTLSKDPRHRYASIDALATDLRSWLSGAPILARPVGAWEQFRHWTLRHRLVASLLALVTLLLTALTVGATIAALHLKASSEEVERQLWMTRLSKARAARLAHQLGERKVGLEQYSQRDGSHWNPAINDERLAHLPLLDVVPEGLPLPIPDSAPKNSVSFDPHLSRAAFWDGGVVSIVHLDSRSIERQWTSGFSKPVARTQFNPSGTQLLVELAPNGPFQLIDLGSGTTRAHIQRGSFLGFTPDAQTLVFREEVFHRALFFIDANSGLETRTLQLGPSLSRLATFGSNPSEPAFVVATLANIQFIHSQSGQTLSAIPHNSPTSKLGLCNGFFAMGDEYGAIQIWDLWADRHFRVEGHRTEVSRLQFTATGRWLITSSLDGECRIWDPFVGELSGVTDQFDLIAVDRLGIHAIVTQYGKFQRATLEPGTGRTVLDVRRSGPGTIRHLDWSTDDGRLLISRFSGLSVFDVKRARELAFHPLPGATAGFFLSDTSVLAADRTCLTHIQLQESAGRIQLVEDQEADLPDSTWLSTPVLSADRKWLLAHFSLRQTNDSAALPTSGAVIGPFAWPFRFQSRNPEAKNITQACIDSDGEWCAFIGDGSPPAAPSSPATHGVHIVRSNPAQNRQFHPMEANALALSPNGKFLAVGGQRTVTVLRTQDWSVEHVLQHRSGTSTESVVAWSADSTKLALGKGRDPIDVWNTRAWSHAVTLESPSPQITTCLAFSRNGSSLAVGTEAGRVEIWQFHTMSGPERVQPPLTGSVVPVEEIPETKSTFEGRKWFWPKSSVTEPERDPISFGARPAQATADQLDLSRFFNASLDGPWPLRGGPDNTLGPLPRGLQTFGGITFDLRGAILLNSIDLAPIAPNFPWELHGIPIDRKCRALHFLQCAANAYGYLPEGFEVGQIVVHYEDGSRAIQPLRLQRETGDWWYNPSNPIVSRDASVAWTGINAGSEPNGRGIRIFQLKWTNPHPERPLKSLSLVSAHQVPNFILLAVTTE